MKFRLQIGDTPARFACYQNKHVVLIEGFKQHHPSLFNSPKTYCSQFGKFQIRTTNLVELFWN